MGIKSNFNKFIREHAEDSIIEQHISHFKYKKVAIDTTLYMFKYKAALSDQWLSGFVNMISVFRRNTVHPVFIFDGPSPIEKLEEQKQRREEKRKLEERVSSLENDIIEYHVKNIISDKLASFVGEDFSIEKAEEMVAKKRKQIINVEPADFDNLKKLLDIMKIPYYTAPSEAEKFCSKLCIDGKVAAAISDDTDVIAYASPVSLSKIDTYTGSCVSVSNENLISSLGLTKEQFLDLCIMCGTDYNNNISRVGSVTSYKYIQKYGSIEGIMDSMNLDVSILNHIRVRELFTLFEEYDIGEIPYCGKPDFDELNEFLNLHGININIFELQSYFKNDNFVFG